jgi:hypothetical protein
MWLKGNLHTHTTNSDGNGTPDEVVSWYSQHGYDFLALTDHNHLTQPPDLLSEIILIPAMEITIHQQDKEIHLNAFNLTKPLEITQRDTPTATIKYYIKRITDLGGLLSVNHPNFCWSLGLDELSRLPDGFLLEIYNGHPAVNNQGMGSYPSVELMWDRLLSGTYRSVWGLAVDDMHQLHGEWGYDYSNPRKGWIMADCTERSSTAILRAIKQGAFYASTGVALSHYKFSSKICELTVEEQRGLKYCIQYIGSEGQVIHEVFGTTASYVPNGKEGYIRCRVMDSNNRHAWTQPFFLI